MSPFVNSIIVISLAGWMALLLWRDLYKSYTGSFVWLVIISHIATILFMIFAMYVGNKLGQLYYRVDYSVQDLMELYGNSRIVAGIGAWLVVSAFMGLFLSAKQDERDFLARTEELESLMEKREREEASAFDAPVTSVKNPEDQTKKSSES
ncbi:hypothetical protein Pla110_01890 [Polystyrenella longa]|uniref:Transmembrane protein n=1 Tax=Polystyrenella longa TaxID=2528007 RepID=A0A518CGY3_9PLAN|nr:hypothetical protein [Polystyrenella longa]QDU78485.1 hypothetical protein Pla110_01890 [Polystyrenella longa]